MKRTLTLLFSALMVLSAARPAVAGEVIDGVVAVVNHNPIFRSDWQEAVCFEAFMQQRSVSAISEEERRKALERVIDRRLLHAQMGDSRYLQPSEADLEQQIDKLRQQLPGGNDEVAWQKTMASYGLSDATLREHLRSEMQVMNFIEARLRPNVHIQPEEVEGYYRNELLVAQQRTGAKPVALQDVEPKIRELLTQQRINELLDAWLHNLRQQAEIQTTVPLPALNSLLQHERPSGAN